MVNLLPSEEEQQVLDSVIEFLASEMPIERLRRATQGDDRLHWAAMARLGWFGLGLPETVGGVGFSVIEEMLLLRACGRHLVTPTLLGTVIAGHVAARARKRDLVERVVAGQQAVSLGRIISGHCGPHVSGEFYLVDAVDGDLVLLYSADGTAIVERSAFSSIRAIPGIDEAATLESAMCEDVEPVAWVPAAKWDYGPRIQLLFAASLLGGAEAVRDITVDYAKLRQQFGKPIAAFQAIKHICADMTVRVEAAAAQTAYAAVTLRDKRPDTRLHAITAKLLASEAAIANGADAIQVHGGIGFTAESDPHRYLKRAHLLSRVAGDKADDVRIILSEAASV